MNSKRHMLQAVKQVKTRIDVQALVLTLQPQQTEMAIVPVLLRSLAKCRCHIRSGVLRFSFDFVQQIFIFSIFVLLRGDFVMKPSTPTFFPVPVPQLGQFTGCLWGPLRHVAAKSICYVMFLLF